MLQGPIAHVTDAAVLLSGAGSKPHAGEDAARLGQMTRGQDEGSQLRLTLGQCLPLSLQFWHYIKDC